MRHPPVPQTRVRQQVRRRKTWTLSREPIQRSANHGPRLTGLRSFRRGSMAIESSVILRKVARIACLVLLFGFALGSAATAQLPIPFKPGNPPPVTVGSVIPFSHGKTGVWKQIYSMKVDPLHGNILFLDSATSTLYQLAPGASTPNLVVGPSTGNSDCSALEKNGTYWNAAVAFDKWDNLYVTHRWGTFQFCRAPYDASSGTWTFSTSSAWTSGPTYKDPTTGNQVPIPPQDLQV